MFVVPKLFRGFSASSLLCHKILHISSGNWDKGGQPPSDHFSQSCSHFGQNEGEEGGAVEITRSSSPRAIFKALLEAPGEGAGIFITYF